MMRSPWIFLIIIICIPLVNTCPVQAGNLHVDQSVSVSGDGLTWPNAKKTIGIDIVFLKPIQIINGYKASPGMPRSRTNCLVGQDSLAQQDRLTPHTVISSHPVNNTSL